MMKMMMKKMVVMKKMKRNVYVCGQGGELMNGMRRTCGRVCGERAS